MSNATEPKRRGCCPPEAAIYRAVNEDPRIEPVVGTAREIGDRLGVIPGHIRALARSGRATKSGWTIPCQCGDGWYSQKPHDDFFCAYGKKEEGHE